MKKFKIVEERPIEGDYAINPLNRKNKPQLVVRYSEDNPTLGFRLKGWMDWVPLSSYHKKVEFI